ncbi:hypothetical protein ABMB67_001383 [Halalkalibacter oceani]
MEYLYGATVAFALLLMISALLMGIIKWLSRCQLNIR